MRPWVRALLSDINFVGSVLSASVSCALAVWTSIITSFFCLLNHVWGKDFLYYKRRLSPWVQLKGKGANVSFSLPVRVERLSRSCPTFISLAISYFRVQKISCILVVKSYFSVQTIVALFTKKWWSCPILVY